MAAATDVESLGYEQARDELVRVVAELEQASPSLEHALELWERGESLARRCEEWLVGARERLEAARRAADDRSPTASGSASGSAARSGGAAAGRGPGDVLEPPA